MPTPEFSTPEDWSVGEIGSAAKYNEQIRDNQIYLRAFPRVYQTSVAGGPTSGTTELVLATLTVPAQSVAYRIIPSAFWTADSSSGNAFAFRIRDTNVSGTVLATVTNEWTGSLPLHFCIAGATAIEVGAGGAPHAFVVTVQRLAGTGTADTNVTGRATALVIPPTS